jgi:hypothetical protein
MLYHRNLGWIDKTFCGFMNLDPLSAGEKPNFKSRIRTELGRETFCKGWFQPGRILFLTLFLGLIYFLCLQVVSEMGRHPEASRAVFKPTDQGSPAGKLSGLLPEGLSAKQSSPAQTQGSQEITPSVEDKGEIMEGDPAEKVVPEIQQKGKVIGNRDSNLYHLSGMKYYDKVLAYHRIEFDSEEEAVQAGYRKAKE